jgi:hypothetical protein
MFDNRSLAAGQAASDFAPTQSLFLFCGKAGMLGFRSGGNETMGALRSVLSDVRCGGILRLRHLYLNLSILFLIW